VIALEPRAPLVVDTRELGRRPGSMRRLSRTVPAPADLALSVVRVPAGSDVRLELRLESVMEGVLVSGNARAHVAGECVRCLEDVERDLDVAVQELFAYDGGRGGLAGDDEEARLQGDLIDLEPTLRDAVVLALPARPLCRDDCPGLCVECGALLAHDPGHAHETIDPRWAALAGLAGVSEGDSVRNLDRSARRQEEYGTATTRTSGTTRTTETRMTEES
jgi:DUF177 domain-containing protein